MFNVNVSFDIIKVFRLLFEFETSQGEYVLHQLNLKMAQNFATRIYICSNTFSFIGWEKVILLCKVGLLPLNAIVWIFIAFEFLTRFFSNRGKMRNFADSADFFIGSLSFLKGLKLNFVNFFITLFRGYKIINRNI